MKKLKIKNADIMRVAIQQEIICSEEARYDHRLHGVLLISQGMSCYKVAQYLGQDSTTVQRWVNRFNHNGFAGLQDVERKGRPKRLTDVQLNTLKSDLRKSPREFDYGQNMWDGKLLSHHLFKHYGVHLGVRQCQRIFHIFGFRLRKPRGVIAQSDPAEQSAYKKTSPLGSKKRH